MQDSRLIIYRQNEFARHYLGRCNSTAGDFRVHNRYPTKVNDVTLVTGEGLSV